MLPAPPPLPTRVDECVAGMANSIRHSLSKFQPMPKDLAKAVSERLIFDPLMQRATDPQNPDWSQLGSSGSWDRSRWLTPERFNKDLRSILFDVELSKLEDTPDTVADERTRALLRRPLPFVAIVN